MVFFFFLVIVDAGDLPVELTPTGVQLPQQGVRGVALAGLSCNDHVLVLAPKVQSCSSVFDRVVVERLYLAVEEVPGEEAE